MLRRNATEPVKKFKNNGAPDEQYFGAGMYANYLYEPAQRQMLSREVHPDLANRSSLVHLVTDAPRSLEFYKERGDEQVRLVIRTSADDMEGYARSLGVHSHDISNVPDISGGEKAPELRFFDFELAHQLNFTSLEPDQKPISNELTRAMTSVLGCGVMIQLSFTRSLQWGKAAETASANLSSYLKSSEAQRTGSTVTGLDRHLIPMVLARDKPRTREVSSQLYKTGKRIEGSYHKKASSPLLTLSIRGAAAGSKDEVSRMLQNIKSVFSSVEFIGDSLCLFEYDIDGVRGNLWIRNNAMASIHAAEILERNCSMWSDMRWGRGRDYVPFLCLTPEEFSVLVSLPSDPLLHVQYRRRSMTGLTSTRIIFQMGCYI